jgi:hypothetical protein
MNNFPKKMLDKCSNNGHPRLDKGHYCLVSLMWMKIGSNDITAQVPGVS